MFPNTFTVGAIQGKTPQHHWDERALMRVVLPAGGDHEQQVRDILYNHPAIEFVDDPLGVYQEGVPYEALVVVGDRAAAERLKLSLPRFFVPLSFRRLGFEIQHVPMMDRCSVLFGDMLETGLGGECGTIHILKGDKSLEPTYPGQVHGPGVKLRCGQGYGIVALGVSPAGDGLPCVPDLAPDMPCAFVMSPGADKPRVQLRVLNEPGSEGGVTPVLGPVLEDITLNYHTDFEVFEGHSRHADVGIRITPDSAFSRVLPDQRDGVDHLEILGIAVPDPSRSKDVVGLAVKFDQGRRLLSHGLRGESCQIVLIDAKERYAQWRTGKFAKIGRNGVVRDLGIRLERGKAIDQDLPASWAYLGAEPGAPLGWIPLRLVDAQSHVQHSVQQSQLKYFRSEWISASDARVGGAAIYLDWLNHAVRIVAHDADGDGQSMGLAEWCGQQKGLFHSHLAIQNERLELLTRDGNDADPHRIGLRHRQCFRLGPLWVRLHLAPRKGG